MESGQIYIRTEGARTLIVKSPSEWRQVINECIKARQEMEAKGPTEEEEFVEKESFVEERIFGDPHYKATISDGAKKVEGRGRTSAEAEKVASDTWDNRFSAWVKNENDNAINEMKSAGFTEGFFKFVIQVSHGLEQIGSATLLEIARKSECHNTGWPIGVVLTKPEDKPVPLSDGIRAIIKGIRSIVSQVEEFDYWAMNNRGHFFFVRSHEEDASTAQEIARKSKFLWFDVAIWRISEIMSYASNLCTELNLKQNDKIKLTLSYEGLKDRELAVSSHRRAPFIIARKCKVNEYEKAFELQVADIMPKLKDHVYQVAIGLFGLFDFFEPKRAIVDSIVDEFLNSRL